MFSLYIPSTSIFLINNPPIEWATHISGRWPTFAIVNLVMNSSLLSLIVLLTKINVMRQTIGIFNT